MFVVVADVEITRRKRSHLVCDETGQLRYAAARLSQVIDWIAEQGANHFHLELGDDTLYSVTVTHLPDFISPRVKEQEKEPA